MSFCMSGWFTFWRIAVFYGKGISDAFMHWIEKMEYRNMNRISFQSKITNIYEKIAEQKEKELADSL